MRKFSDAASILLVLGAMFLAFWLVVTPSRGVTLLKASAVGNTNTILRILGEGFDVNWRSRNGNKTALMVAAEHGQDRAVECLLGRGADPTLKDRYGKTAWDYASENGWTNLAVIQGLQSP